MRTGPSFNLRIPPWGLAVTVMLYIQLGSALSVDLIAAWVRPEPWLRLSMGALVLLAIARPPLRGVSRRDMSALVGPGITTGPVTVAWQGGLDLLPPVIQQIQQGS